MNNNLVEEEIKVMDGQIIVSILFILSITISIFLTLEEELEKKGENTVFSHQLDKYINLFNRIFTILISIIIIYLSYRTYQIGKSAGKPLKPLKHQLWASILSIIPALIVVWVVLENWNDSTDIADFENLTF